MCGIPPVTVLDITGVRAVFPAVSPIIGEFLSASGTAFLNDSGMIHKSDHERLNSCLKSIKGQFILSYDDEYIRSLYKDFDIIPVERQNNLGKGRFKELIIKNY